MSRPTRSFFGCLVLVALVAPAPGQEPYRVIYPKADRKVAAALLETTQLKGDASVRDALDHLAQLHYTEIVIDDEALTAGGISINKPDSRSFNGESLETVLRSLLERDGLTYVVQNGSLRITTAEAARSLTLVRTYDVTAMLDARTPASEVGNTAGMLAQTLTIRRGRPNEGAVSPIFIQPFKNLLVVVGTSEDHERFQEALDLMAPDADG